MMPVQINKHHCMARKGRLKGFQTAYGLCCNLKPMRAQCMRIMLLWVACLPTQLHNGHLNRHYQHGMQRPSENLSDGLCCIVKCKKSDTERHFTTAQVGLINPTFQTACGFVGFSTQPTRRITFLCIPLQYGKARQRSQVIFLDWYHSNTQPERFRKIPFFVAPVKVLAV